MLRRCLVFTVSLILWSGCGANVLRPDVYPASNLSNYPNAEFQACGERFMGLGVCDLEVNTPLSQLDFKIQGLHRGRIRIFSESLALDSLFQYEGSRAIEIDLPGVIKNPIVIGFSLSPEFPKQKNNSLEIYGVYGFLLVQPTDAQIVDVHYDLVKTPLGIDYRWGFFVEEGARHLLITSAECGVYQEFDLNGEQSFSLLMSQLFDISDLGECVLTAITDQGQAFILMHWRYASEYVPLAEPVVNFTKGKLDIKADESVTLMTLDDSKYTLSNEHRFAFNPYARHTLRLYTVKGRTLVGEYEPNRGFLWMR